jgi:cytochrome oxidase Cu insertion factor (SCO1/SenC/PrrC family)
VRTLLPFLAAAAVFAQSPAGLNRVAVGAAPPAFELPSASGTKVSLASLAGKNVVLVFYRGYW